MKIYLSLLGMDDALPLIGDATLRARRLDRGEYGTVYSLEDKGLVAKVYFGSDDVGLVWAKHEFAIASRLSAAGISVPKPEGVFRFRSPCSATEHPAFVMEEIVGGILLDQYRSEQSARSKSAESDFARDLHLQELRKAADLGFHYGPLGESNCFYLPLEQKVVLFDFVRWGCPSVR